MKKQKTLILSRSNDSHVDRIVAELEALDHPWVLFDPGDFPEQVELITQLGEDAEMGQLTRSNGEQILLEEISSIWYRRPTPLKADSRLLAIQQTFIEREARAGLWG